MFVVIHNLKIIELQKEFSLKFQYDIRSYPDDDLNVFEVRVYPLGMTTVYPIVILHFSILCKEKSNCPIREFFIPHEIQGHRVGGFILNKIYELMPESIRPYAFVRGALVHSDSSESRDFLFKKLINYGNCPDAYFKRSTCESDGRFSGRFHNVGTSWNKSLILIT